MRAALRVWKSVTTLPCVCGRASLHCPACVAARHYTALRVWQSFHYTSLCACFALPASINTLPASINTHIALPPSINTHTALRGGLRATVCIGAWQRGGEKLEGDLLQDRRRHPRSKITALHSDHTYNKQGNVPFQEMFVLSKRPHFPPLPRTKARRKRLYLVFHDRSLEARSCALWARELRTRGTELRTRGTRAAHSGHASCALEARSCALEARERHET